MRWLPLVIAALLVWVDCGIRDTAGGTSDTGNTRVAATILLPGGSPATGALVRMRPADVVDEDTLNPSGSGYSRMETTVNNNGDFEFEAVDTGRYLIEVNDLVASACVLPCTVTAGSRLIALGTGTIQPYATVRGTVVVPKGGENECIVKVFGLDRSAPIDTAGYFSFTDLPAGQFKLLVTSRDSSFSPVLVDSVKAVSGAVVQVPYAGWKYRKQLWLNTTSGGAGIMDPVINFPVLVRLSKDHFDFSKAAADGRDLRFAKSDGTPLPYEIERWDSVEETGIVWVKADTVYGNSAEQVIVMYCGFTGATDASDGTSVYDTANGHIGVWHLSAQENGTARDATLHHYDGIPTDTAPQPTPGVIGSALRFDGKANGLVMKNTTNSPLNFSRPGSYTFSAWVNVDTVYGDDEFIAGKGHDQYSLRVKGSASVPANKLAIHEYDDRVAGTDMRFAPVETGMWKYIVGMRNGETMYFFVDGICVDSTGMVYSGKKTVKDSTSFSIGRCGAPFEVDNYLPFKGIIDEVRVSARACTPGWVKLCYENQRPDDRLVQFTK
jgi:hypothetical protein